MSVSTETNQITYTGNGVTVAFPTTFKFLLKADLLVEQAAAAAPTVFSPLTLTTHYTVAGADDDAGGTVTLLTPPPTGDKVRITRTVPFTQTVDLRTNGPFSPETLGRMSDKLTMECQQLDRRLDLAEAGNTAAASTAGGIAGAASGAAAGAAAVGAGALVFLQVGSGEGEAPSYQNSWEPIDNVNRPTCFGHRTADWLITMFGAVVGGSGVIFTLPGGYRPSATIYLPTVSNNAFGIIKVDANGDVSMQSGSNTSFSLECSFWMNQP